MQWVEPAGFFQQDRLTPMLPFNLQYAHQDDRLRIWPASNDREFVDVMGYRVSFALCYPPRDLAQ